MAPRSSLTVQIAMRIKEVESTNQHYMYDTVCQSLGTDFIHGHSHMTLVAYGPYNNGKSYTLIGDTDEESSKGILPRLVNDVMNRLVILSVKTRTQYLYYVSFIEIYNDIVIDLLSTRGGEAQTSFVLDIDELGYTHIQGVNKMACTSYDDVIHWLKLGLSRRNTKTIDSHVSSLSHVVFTFHVYSLQEGRLVKYNKLIFIDLTSNESENLIEESIHGYNEYYNSSYQIIYDVIANKYQFVVPNYFTAIHKYLQDAFNTNLVRPMKGKNQIDFVPNHMRTIVLCCISNEPLYATDVNNCVSLLSYIYSVYSGAVTSGGGGGGSLSATNEQINREVFISYLRNKQMDAALLVGGGQGGVKDETGHPQQQQQQTQLCPQQQFTQPECHVIGELINVNNTFSQVNSHVGFQVTNSIKIDDRHELIDGGGRKDTLTSSEVGYVDTSLIQAGLSNLQLQNPGVNPVVGGFDSQTNSSHILVGSHAVQNGGVGFVGYARHNVNSASVLHNIPMYSSNVNNLNQYNRNQLGTVLPAGHPRITGSETNVPYLSQTNNISTAPGSYSETNTPYLFNQTSNNVSNFNHFLSNCDQNDTRNVSNFSPTGGVPSLPIANPSCPTFTPPSSFHDGTSRGKTPGLPGAQLTTNGGSPCERKINAIETRKRSTCRPSLCKIDEETDNGDETENETSEDDEECNGNISDKCDSEKNGKDVKTEITDADEEESDAYNSSDASDSNSGSDESNEEAIMEDNESFEEDGNEDLRSDDETICTDNEDGLVMEELGVKDGGQIKTDVADGEGRTDSVDGYNGSIQKRAEKTDSGEFGDDLSGANDGNSFTENTFDSKSKVCNKSMRNEPRKCSNSRTEKVDTENDTSGIFSSNVNSGGLDEIKTDDEVSSDMSEDDEEENVRDDTKSIPTSDVGSEEAIALAEQELQHAELTQTHENIQENSRGTSYQRVFEETNNQKVPVENSACTQPVGLQLGTTGAFVKVVPSQQCTNEEGSHTTENPWENKGKPNVRLNLEEQQIVDRALSEVNDDTVSKEESSELNTTTEIDSEDSEEDIDEEEVDHVNELMVRSELDKMYAELDEKIQVLNANYLKELFPDERITNDEGGLIRNVNSGRVHTLETYPDQVNCPPNPQNSSQIRPESIQNTNHQHPAYDPNMPTRYGQFGGYPSYNQPNFVNFHSNNFNVHNLVGAYVNDNLVVQRLNDDNGDNQTLNRTEHFNGTDNNQAPRANVNTFPRDLNDNPTHMFNHHHHPENKNFHDPNSSQSQNCQPSAFATYTPSESPANNGLLFNSNSPTTNPLPSDNHSVLKSMSPQQINTNAPQNSTFFGNMVHSPNGAGNRPPLTGRPMDFSHMQNGHLVNSAQYMGNLPFPVNNHAIAAFQALGANGIHPLPYMTNNHQIERQIQTNIPMLPIGRGVTNGPNGHRNYTEEYSPQQLSLDNGCQPQDPQHAHFQTNIPSHQMNSPYQTETRTINSSQGSEDKKAHLSKGDSGKESTESAANKPETSRSRESNGKGKRKSSKSRRKRDSTHSSGECTNESGSQKGRRHKKCSKDSGNSAQNPINTPVDVETFNSGAMPVPNGGTMIENEMITNMNSLKVTDEYCPVERNHTVSNATILNGLPHNLEDIVNLTANMAGMKVNNSIEPRDVQLNLNEQSANVNPVPDLKIKSNKAHKPPSAEPHLSNVLSSCEFQRVWNDIDTKKSQMNVILLDLDTASERINELKQLLNLKNHLLKFLVNNKPLRDEVRNKLDARSVQLKTKMKKLKRELTELKNMEEKINLEKLNLKFKKNKNGGDANRQLILFNHLNRMKHEEEPPAVKNGKRVHRKHHRDSERKMIKPHENNEDGFAARNNRGIFNHQKVGSLGNESSLSALVNKYALEGNVRQNELTGGVHGGMYESDEDPMASNGTSLSAGIANLKTQIEATERRLHNLDVITKITMQSDEQIDELNENLSKWTKILSFFEKRVESETLKKEQLENNLVLNLYKIRSMEETFGQERRHKDEVLHDISDLIDKLKPNKNLVEALKVEKDVTESDKTIKPDSNDSGSNATLSKTSDAKVEATTEHNDKRNNDWTESNARCKSGKETKSNTSQSKDTRTDKSDIECSNISTNKQEVKTKTIEFECQANFSVPCDSLQLPKDLKLNKATNTDSMPSVETKVAETSSQTDQEIGQKTSDPTGPIETDTPCKTVEDNVKVDHQTIKEYNKEVTTLTPLNKQANKKCDVIETLMNGSDKKLDNLLETESSIDTLGSTSMRNYKISNSTEISTDNAISMSDKSGGGVSLAGVAEKRKKKLSLFSSFRSSEKPSEKSSSGKKFKIFNLNKSGDKNKSNDSIRCDKNKSSDSIRFKKPDDQMSNCSNQSANVKAPQASKDDDKLSNSSLASKLGVIVENSSAVRVATAVNVGNGEEKKNNDPAESGNGTERGASKSVSGQCSNPCAQQTKQPSCCQTCQTNDVTKPSDAINNTKDTIGARTGADERKARRDTLKADINKLLELKQEIVEKRITLCPRKCSTEQSEEKKKMFFEYDEAIETVDALIEYKGNLIRDLDELVHMGNHLKPSVDEILHMGNHLIPSGISKNDTQADGTSSTTEVKPGTDSRLHSVPNRLPTLDKLPNGGGPPNSSEDIVYPNLMSKLTHLSHNELVFVLYKCFARIIDLRTTTVELEKLVQSLDYKLEMKITSLQEMDLKFQRHLQKNQISNEKHLTLLQKDYLNKLHLFYECYCTDHSQSGGDGRSQSTSPTSTARMELNESLLLKEENKFLKSRVKCLEAELRKKSEERGGDGGGGGGYALVPRGGGGQVERINQLSNIPSSWNKTITVENNKLVISRKK